jgi:two-component system response regulator DesR
MSSTLISPSQRELEGQAPNSRIGDDARRRGEIALLIVDDHRAARYSVWALLSWKRDIRVTGTANGSAEALTLAKRRRPDACLISATLGQGEALTLASRMKHLIDPPRVLIFADAVDQHLACAATVAGADGVLCRYADPEEQAGVIRRAASGEQQFPSLQPTEIHALLDQVEDGDRAIVAMLIEHTHPDHIAGLLGISARSLELRRQGILKRSGRPAESTTIARTSANTTVRSLPRAPARRASQTRAVRLSARSFRDVIIRCHGSRTAWLKVRSRRICPTASIRNRAVLPSRLSKHRHCRHQVSGREPVCAPWPRSASG